MSSSSKRGLLIVFEGNQLIIFKKKFKNKSGLDRSGKSTQARRLVESLNAKAQGSAVLQAFPGNPTFFFVSRPKTLPDRSSPIGKLIDQYLKKEIDLDEHSLHLMFSADRFLKVHF